MYSIFPYRNLLVEEHLRQKDLVFHSPLFAFTEMACVTANTAMASKNPSENYFYLVEFILQEMNPEFTDANSMTPIHIAARLGHSKLVKFLRNYIENSVKRARVIKILDPVTGFEEYYTEVEVEFLNEPNQKNSIVIAEGPVREGGILIRKSDLRNCNISGNAFDNLGQTPMLFAAKNGHIEVVEALKGVGNPNAPQKNGDTPIHLATRNGHLEIVKILLQYCKDRKDANDLFLKSLPLVKNHYIR